MAPYGKCQSTEKELEHFRAMLCRIDPWWLAEMTTCVGAFQAIERLAELGDPSLIEPLTELLKEQDWNRRFDVKEALERAVEKIRDNNRNILSKHIWRVFVSKSKHDEVCAGCGRRLPVSVQACIYKGRILCEECDRRNRAHAKRVEQAMSEHEQKMVKFRKEQEEKRRQEMAKVPVLMRKGEPFKAKEIMELHYAEPELWKELAECFERKGVLQSAIMIYNRYGYNSERVRVADKLGLTGHSCEKHRERPVIGKCMKCKGYFCSACGDECAGNFACKSCLAWSRKDWLGRAGIVRRL